MAADLISRVGTNCKSPTPSALLGFNVHGAMTLLNKELGHSHGKVKRLLGMDWSGVFVHDGWSVYEKFASATHQECFAHGLRRCDSLMERGTGGALALPRGVKDVLLTGFEYRNRF